MSDGELDAKWLFRTSGPNCHWCASGETIHVWGPYGTNVCAFCEDLITEGRERQVGETVVARSIVRDTWYDVDRERWLEREHALIERWLALRTDCTEVPPGTPHCEPANGSTRRTGTSSGATESTCTTARTALRSPETMTSRSVTNGRMRDDRGVRAPEP
jgi:hypothetical protein